MIIVNGWKPLTIITNLSILDVAAALDQLPINCDETNSSLTKEKYFSIIKLDLHSNYFFSNDSTLYFSFHICTFDRSRKASFTAAVWSEIFLDKNRKHFHFSDC